VVGWWGRARVRMAPGIAQRLRLHRQPVRDRTTAALQPRAESLEHSLGRAFLLLLSSESFCRARWRDRQYWQYCNKSTVSNGHRANPKNQGLMSGGEERVFALFSSDKCWVVATKEGGIPERARCCLRDATSVGSRARATVMQQELTVRKPT
jgi:hypothetical protein